MAEISTYKNMVQPKSVDCTRRASVAAMIGYMLDVAGEDADKKGFGISALDSASNTWVLSRLAVDIIAQPKQYEDIAIDTWVNEFNRLSSTRNFRIHRSEECIAMGVSQWCMLNMDTRQVVDMSLLKETYMQAMVDEPSPISAPARLRPIAPANSASRPVVYSDIDFNRHMNTMRYIDFIFDNMPLELIEQNNGLRIDLNFIAEALYGETLTIGWVNEDNIWNFEISSSPEKILCRAKVEFK